MFDLLHARTCDADEAINSAGLRLLKLEVVKVLKRRQGTFKASRAHYILRGMAVEMFKKADEDSNLFLISCLKRSALAAMSKHAIMEALVIVVKCGCGRSQFYAGT